MFGKTIKLRKEVYEDLIAERDKARKELDECKLQMIDDRIRLQDQWAEVFSENVKLEKQNACLKTLIDKENDTQVIKYNGKLYRITSTTHCKQAGVEETLDFTAVLVSEVC